LLRSLYGIRTQSGEAKVNDELTAQKKIRTICSSQAKPKLQLGGGDLRKAQVDVNLSVSNSCISSQSWAQ